MSRNITAGFAICGSFCTFSKVLPCLEGLVQSGMNVIPILSQNAATMDTRFFKAQDFTDRVRMICQRELITTIPEAEPIGPKKLLDILVIAPCTGNTLGKLANGITDTPVTMATKSHLRNGPPVLIGVSTNDALGISARSIAMLENAKNIYFVPMRQDDPEKKPTSMVLDFSRIPEAIDAALEGRQLRPLIIP